MSESPELNPCVPLDESDNNNNQSGGTSPEESERNDILFEEVFLSPNETLRETDRDLTTADREINIVNPELFVSDLAQYRIPSGDQDYNAKLPLVLDPTSTANPDMFRLSLNKLWSWDGNRETWLESYYGQPYPSVFTYEVTDEQFAAYWGKSWLSNLRVTFNNIDAARSSFVDSRDFRGTPFHPLLRVGQNDRPHHDDVSASEQPFYADELDRMSMSQFTSAEIKAEVDFFEEQPPVKKIFIQEPGEATGRLALDPVELKKTSLYRYYDKTVKEEEIECYEDTSVQKFTCDAVKKLNDINESTKNNFNERVEITINTQQGSRISNLLDEYQMDKYILEILAGEPNMELPAIEPEFVEILDETLFERGDPVSVSRRSSNDRINLGAKRKVFEYVFEHGSIISRLSSKDASFYRSINRDTYPIPFQYSQREEEDLLIFTDTIRSQIFMNKFESLVKTPQNIRSFKDILSGKKAFSEIIAYKIEKFNIGDEVEILERDRPMQTFLLMDSDEIKTINFVDTQVRPGSKYVYRISSISFVIASEYSYFQVSDRVSTDMEFEVATSPVTKLIEAPFFEKVVTIAEKPPLAPQVSFVPFQGVDNKMQILLQSNFGERKENPISILPGDQDLISRMRESQETRQDGTLEYATDSMPVSFQVLRLSQAPESYTDFSTPDYVKDISLSGRAAMFVDDEFEPNKDYYYIFRSFDSLGVSNPSDVYRVKMVSYQNGIYMDLEQYVMKPAIDPVANMVFQRVLKIMPAAAQRSLRFSEEAGDLDSRDFVLTAPEIGHIDLGTNTQNSIWGRKFKFRLTSEQTGRKIDINIRFEKHKETITDLDPQIAQDVSDPCRSHTPNVKEEEERKSGNTSGYSPPDPDEPFY